MRNQKRTLNAIIEREKEQQRNWQHANDGCGSKWNRFRIYLFSCFSQHISVRFLIRIQLFRLSVSLDFFFFCFFFSFSLFAADIEFAYLSLFDVKKRRKLEKGMPLNSNGVNILSATTSCTRVLRVSVRPAICVRPFRCAYTIERALQYAIQWYQFTLTIYTTKWTSRSCTEAQTHTQSRSMSAFRRSIQPATATPEIIVLSLKDFQCSSFPIVFTECRHQYPPSPTHIQVYIYISI